MMNIARRAFVCGAGAWICLPAADYGRDEPEPGGQATLLPLWPGLPPGGGGPVGPVRWSSTGALSNIAVPALEIYRPARPNGRAVLVAGGGGYKRIEMEKEARPAARWLTRHGFTAGVLRYRLPREGWSNGPLAPLQDAQRALRLMAAMAGAAQLERDRISVLGFSAGGHLLGLAATRSRFASYAPLDAVDRYVPHPARAALIYPVVTLLAPYDHTSTRVQLIGLHPTLAESMAWSVQTHVAAQCPPLFLVQAQDDPIADIANTAILAQAARLAGVPVERHVLTRGGHGFGMGAPGTPAAAWPEWYRSWLGDK